MITCQEERVPAIEVVHEAPFADDHLISLLEACTSLDVSDATLRRYIKDGKVPAYNFGKEYKFKVQELSDFVESTRVEPKKPVKPARQRRAG